MRTASLVFCAVASLLAACGGSSELSSTPAPVVDASVTSVTVGMAFLGSLSCAPSGTYERASHALSWSPCPGDAGAGAAPPSSRVLTASEAGQVDAALAAVTLRPAAEQACGGEDGMEYYLQTFDAAGKSTQYSAYNINCYNYPRVTGLTDLYGLLEKLH